MEKSYTKIEKVLLKNRLLTNIQITKITHEIKDEIAKHLIMRKIRVSKFNSVNIDEYELVFKNELSRSN